MDNDGNTVIGNFHFAQPLMRSQTTSILLLYIHADYRSRNTTVRIMVYVNVVYRAFNVQERSLLIDESLLSSLCADRASLLVRFDPR